MSSETVIKRNIVLREKEEIENMIVKSEFYPSNMIIEESYCTNPKCNCRNVTLKFLKVDEKNKENEPLFSIKLNIDTFKVVDKTIYDKSVRSDDIIDEFLIAAESEIRDRLNENYKIVKDEDQKILKPINQNIKELMSDGSCITYAEIFDNVETFTFRDDNDNLIYIDDQYCMSPKCHCNETFLSFIEIDEFQGKAKNLFTLRYSLKKEKYDIEFESLNEKEVKTILKSFKTKEKQIRGKLKKRYDDMKSIGTKINDEDKIKIVPQINDTTVGRNDVCPCGSGKKYKKCCGK